MMTFLTLVLIAGIIMAVLLWYQYQPSLRLRCFNGHLNVTLSWWKYFEQASSLGDTMLFRERTTRQLII